MLLLDNGMRFGFNSFNSEIASRLLHEMLKDSDARCRSIMKITTPRDRLRNRACSAGGYLIDSCSGPHYEGSETLMMMMWTFTFECTSWGKLSQTTSQ